MDMDIDDAAEGLGRAEGGEGEEEKGSHVQLPNFTGGGDSRRYTLSITCNRAFKDVFVEYILPFGSRQWVSSVNVSL